MYFRILELFLLRTFFNKDEYNFNSKFFNPLKIVFVIIMVTGFASSIYLYTKLSKVYTVIEIYCPELARRISEGEAKESLISDADKNKLMCNLR